MCYTFYVRNIKERPILKFEGVKYIFNNDSSENESDYNSYFSIHLFFIYSHMSYVRNINIYFQSTYVLCKKHKYILSIHVPTKRVINK